MDDSRRIISQGVDVRRYTLPHPQNAPLRLISRDRKSFDYEQFFHPQYMGE
jgi:hypothetical protein